MGKHSYLTTMDYELWEDLTRLKKLDGQSMNSQIKTACRQYRDRRITELSEQRKRRTTLENMVTV